MTNFEDAIKDYVTKVHHPDNPVIFHYQLNRRFRTQTILISNPPKAVSGSSVAIDTPLGHFHNIRLAAAAHGCTSQTIYNRIHRKMEGYGYGKPEQEYTDQPD